jgi:hypothetical protein
MMSTNRRFLPLPVAVLSLLAGGLLAAAFHPAAGLPPAQAQPLPPQCGDSVDLPWRCLIVSSGEVAQAMQALEDACFEMGTVSVAPWSEARSGYVTEYLLVGRQPAGDCP